MFRLTAMAVAIAIFTAGCTGGAGEAEGVEKSKEAGRSTVDESTMTQKQALVRVEQLIKETAKIVEPKPRLDLYRPSLTTRHCLNPADGGSEERMVITRIYHLRDIPRDRISDVSRQVRQYWEQQGHLITGTSANGLNVFGLSRPDDFLLSLESSGDDLLNLGASSPCIWPNGTPEPSASA